MISTLPIYGPNEAFITTDVSSRQSSDWENSRRNDMAFHQDFSRIIPSQSQKTIRAQIKINSEFQDIFNNIDEFEKQKTHNNSEEIPSCAPFSLMFHKRILRTSSFPLIKTNYIIYLYSHCSRKDYFVETSVLEFLNNIKIPALVIDQLAKLTTSVFAGLQNFKFCLYHDPEVETEPQIRIEATVSSTIEQAVRQNECWHERLVNEFPKDIFSKVCLSLDLIEK